MAVFLFHGSAKFTISMKNLRLLFLGLLLSTFACSPNNPEQAKEEQISPKEVNHSYLYKNDKDSVKLNFQESDGKVTGNLAYSYFEKDKSKGTIEGEMIGDLLVADYTFESEGIVSIRQVAFKKTEGGMKEGFGPIEEKNGKLFLKSLDSLNFENSLLLKEVD